MSQSKGGQNSKRLVRSKKHNSIATTRIAYSSIPTSQQYSHPHTSHACYSRGRQSGDSLSVALVLSNGFSGSDRVDEGHPGVRFGGDKQVVPVRVVGQRCGWIFVGDDGTNFGPDVRRGKVHRGERIELIGLVFGAERVVRIESGGLRSQSLAVIVFCFFSRQRRLVSAAYSPMSQCVGCCIQRKRYDQFNVAIL